MQWGATHIVVLDCMVLHLAHPHGETSPSRHDKSVTFIRADSSCEIPDPQAFVFAVRLTVGRGREFLSLGARKKALTTKRKTAFHLENMESYQRKPENETDGQVGTTRQSPWTKLEILLSH